MSSGGSAVPPLPPPPRFDTYCNAEIAHCAVCLLYWPRQRDACAPHALRAISTGGSNEIHAESVPNLEYVNIVDVWGVRGGGGVEGVRREE